MKKRISVYLTLIVIGFFSGTLFPGDFNIVKVNEWGTGYYWDVFIQDQYAYCAASYEGLDIIDISDPSNPRRVGNIKTPECANKVYVKGNYAYVTHRVIGYSMEGGGLLVIDITHPSCPILVGTYDFDWATNLEVRGDYAYVTASDRLKIIDVSTPHSPTLAADFGLTPSEHPNWYFRGLGLNVKRNYAYIAVTQDYGGCDNDDYGALAIIDISDPGAPQLAGFYDDLGDEPLAVYVRGNYAYFTTRGNLTVLDVSNPGAPVKVGRCGKCSSTNPFNGDIQINGQYAYLASGKNGLQIVDRSELESLTLVGSFEMNGSYEVGYNKSGATNLYITGDYAYVAAGGSGLHIVDISKPDAPKGIGQYTSGQVIDLGFRRRHLYLLKDRQGLDIFDVSNPLSPVKKGTYDHPGDLKEIIVSGEHAYIFYDHKYSHYNMDILDISDPFSPTLMGTYNFLKTYSSVSVSGNYAYILFGRYFGNCLQIVDISGPSFPTLVGTYNSVKPGYYDHRKMYISGNYAYIAVEYFGLLVLDISNPSSPVEVGNLEYRITYGISLYGKGNDLYLWDEGNGLTVIDISDPVSPVITGKYDTGRDIKILYAAGNYVFSADENNDLMIIDVSDPASPKPVVIDDTPANVADILVKGDYIYMADAQSGKLIILKNYDPAVTPRIRLNNPRLLFLSSADSRDAPGPQSFFIKNSGGGTLNWSLSFQQDWLSCSPAFGTNRGVVSVSVDTGNLAAGSYLDTIQVIDPLAVNSPQSVYVILNVSDRQAPTPFGVFATPVDNSLVSGSVPFTGWVLDDVGVAGVQLFREEKGSLVYIGDAVLIEGARPDIEKAYPNYPNNSKAGWGYMLLTHFLPNGGNGTFKIHAIAIDLEGNQVTLGTKTINCDNINAIKPFGTMDTPGQGGTASGNNYINWGWALTPQPNTIPTDGSTITVWVDGVPLGKPFYNRHRQDIADLFSNYNNSNGAGGYFYLDTTLYENGVHTISWSVTDDAGNTDGIGSRYFSIQNTSQSARRTAQRAPGISKIPVDYSQPLPVKRGFNPDVEPQIFYPDKTGQINIEIRELERVEIWLSEGTRGLAPLSNGNKLSNSHWTGFQVIGSRYRSLPIGSFLDTERGVFCWHPGTGFVGNYRFVFIAGDQYGNKTKKKVLVTVVPKFSRIDSSVTKIKEEIK